MNTQRTKWAKFTYVSKETGLLTKLSETNIRIAFTTRTNNGQLLSKQNSSQQNKYDTSGVYQLTCQDCVREYIGQMGRSFHIIFIEHFRNNEYENNKSNFAKAKC
jgi:hypothetical protein